MSTNTNRVNNPMKVITGPDTRWSYANILRRNKADAGGKHPWKAEALEGNVPAATITNWYKEVYEPTYTTTSEKQG